MKKAQSLIAVDPILDKALATIGVNPNSIEDFLSKNKTSSRIAANTLSVARVVLGFIAINKYETAKTARDKKGMAASMVSLGVIMATDAFDGYITRKAHINNSTSGRIIDSASDVAFRLALARSSLSENDRMAVVRGISELVVASSAIPDILEGTYTSTSLGKMKVNTDALAVITSVLKDLSEHETTTTKSLQLLHDAARTVSTGLAMTDGIKRVTQKG